MASSVYYSTSKSTNMDLTWKSMQVEMKNDKSMKLENIAIPKKNTKSSMYQSSDDESILASPEKEIVKEKMSKMQISSKL
eukprot:13833892-Ditylum_brightwellii.AAC.1